MIEKVLNAVCGFCKHENAQHDVNWGWCHGKNHERCLKECTSFVIYKEATVGTERGKDSLKVSTFGPIPYTTINELSEAALALGQLEKLRVVKEPKDKTSLSHALASCVQIIDGLLRK